MKEYITQDVLQECWFLLKYFESEEFVSNKLKETHFKIKETTLKTVSQLICNYIKQAKELYVAYENTSYLTNPLLLYYAFNNLAKAYVLFQSPKTTLHGSHGLELNREDIGKKKVIDTKITINSKGTFTQFEKIVNGKFSTNEKISIDVIFSNIPDLINVYKISYDKEPNVYVARKNNNAKYNEYLVDFDNEPNMTAINEILKVNGSQMTISKRKDKYVGSWYMPINNSYNEENFIKDIMGNRYFSYGFNYIGGRNTINNLVIYYLMVYAYSMYTRYYPNEWQTFLNSKESGIICKSIEISKYQFLIDIVKLFMGEDFNFASKIEDIGKKEDIRDLTDKILKEIKDRQFVSNGHALDGII